MIRFLFCLTNSVCINLMHETIDFFLKNYLHNGRVATDLIELKGHSLKERIHR
jgi:hypothetical protein